MKKMCKALSVFLIFLLAVSGCGKKQETVEKVEEVLPTYQCDFLFEDIHTTVSLTKDDQSVTVSNRFDSMAFTLYEILKADRFNPVKKPAGLKESESVSLHFENLLLGNQTEETPDFTLTSKDLLIFHKESGAQYFEAEEGTYQAVLAQCDALLQEKAAYYTETQGESGRTVALLKADGTVARELAFAGREILYQKEVLLLEDTENAARYFYDRGKAVLSAAVPLISDYLEGYICYVEEKELKLISVSDQGFSYSEKNFEKPPADTENPFVSLVLKDQNTAEITYLTNENELYSQAYDLSPFYKDYEEKKSKPTTASTSSSKPKAPSAGGNYEYVSPAYSTANGIQPFSTELEAKLMNLSNTRKDFSWKGSENNQSYYSQFNAYATGNRNKNVVYLTFDEGYEYNENTNKILDILAEKGVKAVFFVTMDFAKKRPDLVRRIIDNGHTLGNHSTKHPAFPTISLQRGYDEILNLHNYILSDFGYTMSLFRFPQGAFSERTLALVSEMGYASVFWNCAYKDWDTANQPSPDTTRALVANQTQNGTIYLFHAVSNTNVSMLGEIIDTVRAAGYEFGLFGSD